jgi:hypothetical protein
MQKQWLMMVNICVKFEGLTVSEEIEIKEFCIFLSLPWQQQPYWNMSTLPATHQCYEVSS